MLRQNFTIEDGTSHAHSYRLTTKLHAWA